MWAGLGVQAVKPSITKVVRQGGPQNLNRLIKQTQRRHGALKQRGAREGNKRFRKFIAEPNTRPGGNNNHRNGALGV
jgi:hypothetical protein